MSGKEDEECRDVVTRCIGSFGRYQLRQILLISAIGIAAAWHMMVISFMAPGADRWCARPEEYRNMSVEQWKKYAIPPDPDVSNEHLLPLSKNKCCTSPAWVILIWLVLSPS